MHALNDSKKVTENARAASTNKREAGFEAEIRARRPDITEAELRVAIARMNSAYFADLGSRPKTRKAVAS